MESLESLDAFVVNVKSKEDGHVVTHGHYSTADLAHKIAKTVGGSFYSCLLWKDQAGRVCKVQKDFVTLDREFIRESALKKLTQEEKEVLGVK